MRLFFVILVWIFAALLLSFCGDGGTTPGGGIDIEPPENFSIIDDTDSTVTFSWELTSFGEEQIIVERRNTGAGGDFGPAASLQPGTEQFTDSLLNPNLRYQYRWRVTGNGEEAVSDVITIRNERNLAGQNRIGTIQHDDDINAVAFGPVSETGSLHIAYGSTDATAEIRMISGNTISGVQERLLGHTARITSVNFHPDGSLLATASSDGTARLWDISSGETVHTFSGHISSVRSVDFDGGGSLVVTGGTDGDVKVWDAGTGELQNTFSNGSNYEAAALSPDGSLVAGSGHNKLTVDVWEQESGVLTILQAHTARVLSLDFSPDGVMLASSGEDNSIRIWDVSVAGRNLIGQILSAHFNDVNSVVFGPGGRFLVSGGGQSLKVWDLQDLSGPALTFNDHIAAVRSAAISPDGRLIASGSVDNRVIVYRLTYRFFGWDIEVPE